MDCCRALFFCLCLLTSQGTTAEITSKEILHWMQRMEWPKGRKSPSPDDQVHGLEQRLLNATFHDNTLELSTNTIQSLVFKLGCNFTGLSLSSAAQERAPQARALHAMHFPAALTWDTCAKPARPRELRLICIYFFTTSFFQDNNNSSLLNNLVLGAQLDQRRVNNLREPVNISFWHNQSLEGYTLTCVFWKEGAGKNSWGAWSPEGCRVEQPSPAQVLCHCNHLTYFAVLMQLSPAPVPAELLVPLEYISFVGCSVSVVASLLTVLLHLPARYPVPGRSPAHLPLLHPCFPTWAPLSLADQWLQLGPCPVHFSAPSLLICEPRGWHCWVLSPGHPVYCRKQGDSIRHIHMNLHFSVLLLNVTFLLSAVLARPSGAACTVLAALLHYALLSCLTWMAIEGFNLYLLLGRVYNIYIHRYVLKLCTLGWGVPAILVLLILAVKSSVYGPHVIPVSYSQENGTGFQNMSMCWVRSPVVHGVLVMGYGGLTTLFNLMVLAWVLRVLRRLQVQKKVLGSRAFRDTVTVLGLTVLLGTTWALAFFSFSVFLLPQLFLFTIFNSLYGFFLFLWFCFQRYRSEAEAKVGKEALNSSQTVH